MKYTSTKSKTSISKGLLDKNSGGFTIVETLVAITVLMIAIAGPLVVASKGLSSALYARDQIIASFLAQESMEVIKNKRDNNLDGVGSTWIDEINGPGCSSPTATCDANSIEYDQFNSSGPSGGFPILYNGSTGYAPSNTGSPTIFKRYYYLTLMTGSGNCEITSTECTVHVIVSWNEGTVPYEVELDSQLVNFAR